MAEIPRTPGVCVVVIGLQTMKGLLSLNRWLDIMLRVPGYVSTVLDIVGPSQSPSWPVPSRTAHDMNVYVFGQADIFFLYCTFSIAMITHMLEILCMEDFKPQFKGVRMLHSHPDHLIWNRAAFMEGIAHSLDASYQGPNVLHPKERDETAAVAKLQEDFNKEVVRCQANGTLQISNLLNFPSPSNCYEDICVYRAYSKSTGQLHVQTLYDNCIRIEAFVCIGVAQSKYTPDCTEYYWRPGDDIGLVDVYGSYYVDIIQCYRHRCMRPAQTLDNHDIMVYRVGRQGWVKAFQTYQKCINDCIPSQNQTAPQVQSMYTPIEMAGLHFGGSAIMWGLGNKNDLTDMSGTYGYPSDPSTVGAGSNSTTMFQDQYSFADSGSNNAHFSREGLDTTAMSGGSGFSGNLRSGDPFQSSDAFTEPGKTDAHGMYAPDDNTEDYLFSMSTDPDNPTHDPDFFDL